MSQPFMAPRDIQMAVQLGNIAVSINAEGVSWNPTVARDMHDRAIGMLKDMLMEASAYGLLSPDAAFDDDEAYVEQSTGEDDDGE